MPGRARLRRLRLKLRPIGREAERHRLGQFLDRFLRRSRREAEAAHKHGDARRTGADAAGGHQRPGVNVAGARSVRADPGQRAVFALLDQAPVGRGREAHARTLRHLDDEGAGRAAAAAPHHLYAVLIFDLVAVAVAPGYIDRSGRFRRGGGRGRLRPRFDFRRRHHSGHGARLAVRIGVGQGRESAQARGQQPAPAPGERPPGQRATLRARSRVRLVRIIAERLVKLVSRHRASPFPPRAHMRGRIASDDIIRGAAPVEGQPPTRATWRRCKQICANAGVRLRK